MKKIGIMGGTFNPIHIAHLILAERAYEQMHLDEIIFIPSKKPPHKLNDTIASDYHRLSMIELAIKDNPHFHISTMELEREGITYTVDTLVELRRTNPDTEYYFILGADSLFSFETWREPAQILRLSHILVAGRDNLPSKELIKQIQHIKNTYQGNIHYLQVPNMDISSSLIRNNCMDNKSIRYYVTKEVEDYIIRENLYR